MRPSLVFDSMCALGLGDLFRAFKRSYDQQLHRCTLQLTLIRPKQGPLPVATDGLYVYLLVLSFGLVVFTCLYAKYSSKDRSKTLAGTRAALTSLYAVITPTQSFWPPHYLSLARSVAATRHKYIRLPLAMLYRDLLDDVIELKHPRQHLPLLFRTELSVPTRVLLDIELAWWFRLGRRMLSCYMRRNSSIFIPITKHDGSLLPLHLPRPVCQIKIITNAKASYMDNSKLELSPPPPYSRASQDPANIAAAFAPPSTLFYSMLYENAPSVSLDCVPYHTLQACIRRLQRWLAPGSHLTVGLTTRAGTASRSFTDPSIILTALPFFPRAYLRSRSRPTGARTGEAEYEHERTTTPLFVTLPRVLALLTSGPTPLTVELVRNVSEEYAIFLKRSVHDLEDDWEFRDAFVREWGMAAWREERVCTAWEAALVDAGLLAGWAIVVRK
ncbi:hypothetical protein BD414DRAFT_485186 [Trametes punicea]|nr:hypothetical protein BD414DRAFT_485186 [Trametes punicea]